VAVVCASAADELMKVISDEGTRVACLVGCKVFALATLGGPIPIDCRLKHSLAAPWRLPESPLKVGDSRPC
jgi:hypothetical protein